MAIGAIGNWQIEKFGSIQTTATGKRIENQRRLFLAELLIGSPD
jgi:hypothetical protein